MIKQRKCRVCGCTDHDCRQCIQKTGEPCHWIEADLCSACKGLGKIRPILFSTPMVQAILEGRKTMTRRVIPIPDEITLYNDDYAIQGVLGSTDEFEIVNGNEWLADINCRYGKPEDILYVREAWSTERKYPLAQEEPNRSAVNYIFKADKQEHVAEIMRWKPSIHMPKSAARLWLKIKNIRVERLEDISEEDCIAEGICVSKLLPEMPEGELRKKGWDPTYKYDCHLCSGIGHRGYDSICEDGFFDSARKSFASLWKSINGEKSWMDNPWVWVIEFERIEKP